MSTQNTLPSIIYADSDMMVLDKPAGITVNRSETTIHEGTVQDWIEQNYHDVYANPMGQDHDFYNRHGIVHRLDKETSGILLIAKTKESFEELQRQFKEREVKKTYLALAHGTLIPPEGEINVPVGRLEFNRKRFGIVPGGRESMTHYKVLEMRYLHSRKQKETLSLVELYPKTGRTHQIRVHLKHLNRPIFSDMLYAGRKTSRDDRRLLPRVFLHAAGIQFFHPRTHKDMTFSAPLPHELQSFWDSLEIEG